MSLLKEYESMGVQLVSRKQASVQLSALTLQPSIAEKIQVNKETDPELEKIKKNLDKGKLPGFLIHEDRTL